MEWQGRETLPQPGRVFHAGLGGLSYLQIKTKIRFKRLILPAFQILIANHQRTGANQMGQTSLF